MHARSEQMADYIADRLEFITFLACCSALLGMAMLAPLPTHWRLPGITLLLAGSAWRPCNWGQLAQSAGHLEPLCPARAGDPLAGAPQNPARGPRPRLICR